MQTVHLMSGLPASGKTLAARTLIDLNPGRIRRVNLDDIRAMFDTGASGERRWSRELEDTALTVQDAAVRAALDGGFDVIVDNTHVVPRIPKRLKGVVRGDATFVVHDFTHVPIEECIRRDALRTGPAHVGEEVIRKLADRHAKARKTWRLTDAWMNDWPRPKLYVPEPDRPGAVLCDIDGTLALMGNGRGPYDWHRVGEDLLNDPVAQMLHAARCTYKDRIVLLSGRDSVCRPETEEWLDRHGVRYDGLHMRPQGDTRPDDIVKAELFDTYIRDQFHVRLVLDDRDRLIHLWRRMGLPTWQVNYGNF